MVDAEGRGDGADFPVLAVIEPTNLGVLLGRDHGASPGTRDEFARAVAGARRFPGRRPCNATHPPGARSAPNPSSCPPAVSRGRRPAGKSDPSRGRGRRAGDRDDRGGLRDCVDGVGGRHARRPAALPCDTPTSNRRGRDHTTRRSQRCDGSVDTLSGEAAHPRCRSSSALRLDTALKPWHKRDDRLGPSKHRGGHRGPGASPPGLHLYPRRQPVSLQQSSHRRGGARRPLLTDSGAVLTAAERLHGSSMTAHEKGFRPGVRSMRVQIYAASDDR